MTTSPSSGLSPEAKEFVPLVQNSSISIPLYVDENTVASIYPSDQQPLMVQAIYPMLVTNSKGTDNIQFPEIEFHIQPSQQQQFHIDSCANIQQSSSINGNSSSNTTSQIVLLPTTNSPAGYYPGPQIIYSPNEQVNAFYPIDYCEQPLINFSIQQPNQMNKSNRISSSQPQRPSSFRQQHTTYRPSSRGGGGGNRGNGNPNNRNSYYDYNNRRNGSSYVSNSGRGNPSNSKRISSSYHQHDYNNYYHSSSRSRGYLPRSSQQQHQQQQQQQQQHDEHRKDHFDYYNHDNNDYRQSDHINEDGTPFEFRPEDFPSLPINNNQQSDNKTPTQSIASLNTKSASSWNEIVSASRRRSTSPQSIAPSQDQRSDRSRSFNNKLSINNERKLSNKIPNLQPTISKSPNRASKINSQDEQQQQQQRSSSLTNSDPPIIEHNNNTKLNDIKDDGFIQTKHQHRRLKRKNKIKEESTSFTEQSNEIESAPYALDDENAFPTLGQQIINPNNSELLSKSKIHQTCVSDMFNALSTSTQIKQQNSHSKPTTTTNDNHVDSKVIPKRSKGHEQPKARKSTKVKRILNKNTEENQKQSNLTVEKDIQNETDINTTNITEEDHQNSNTLSSSSTDSRNLIFLMDILSSVAWVKRGAAKATPIKFMPDEEELNSMIDKSGDHDDDDDEQKTKDVEMDVEKDDENGNPDDEDNVIIPGVGPIGMYASNRDDPLLEIKDDGEDSDAEDFLIRPDDNLIVAAHIEDDTSSLEVYVYNDKEGYLYVHHDILMLNMPLCLTWFDYDVNDGNTGNYVAVGSMEGMIELFDVDLVDQMEPLYTFGKKPKKKKSKKSSKKTNNKSGEGHDAAVLDLSWNKLVRQIIASSSADATVALWDLSQMKMALHLDKIHEKQIQSICWHPTEPQNLLSGSADKTVCLIDCRDANNKSSQHRWTFDSDIERVTWNIFDSNQYLASTENGYVYAMDIRQTTVPVFSLSAHDSAVTGLCLSPTVPGFLVTSSFDETVKIWDIENGGVTFIAERQFQTGQINTCIANPDFPFTFAIGGQSKGLQIWDCTENANVRSRFGTRAKFEMVEVVEETASAKPVVSAFPTTSPNVTSAVLKAQRKKSSKKK
ncbi:unnamed protein product [Adineta steineri]|uniref:Uncharacterized protein n=2 Tax=Adineta steineri TaxID=433720 RepID=A0A819G4G5_9BILA|nr:unnamed protein product [Adineta steineri]